MWTFIGCLVGLLGVASGQDNLLALYGAPGGPGGAGGAGGPGSSDPAVAALSEAIPGTPGLDYPIYSTPPETSFSCDGYIEGYYGDPEAECQSFHICANDGNGGLLKYSFICPNGTVFNQQYFICDWWFNFDCSTAEDYYSLNEDVAAAAAAATAAGEFNGGNIDLGLNARVGRKAGRQNRNFGNEIEASDSPTGLAVRKESIEKLPIVLSDLDEQQLGNNIDFPEDNIPVQVRGGREQEPRSQERKNNGQRRHRGQRRNNFGK